MLTPSKAVCPGLCNVQLPHYKELTSSDLLTASKAGLRWMSTPSIDRQTTLIGEVVQACRSAEPAEVVTEELRELDDVAQRRVNFDQHPLPFDDVREAFEGQTTGQLLRSLGVLSACQFRPLVRNADNLLKTSKKLFGSTLVNFGVRHTFFKQFCGGESTSVCPSSLALPALVMTIVGRSASMSRRCWDDIMKAG